MKFLMIFSSSISKGKDDQKRKTEAYGKEVHHR